MEKKDLKFIIIFILIVCFSFAYLFQATYAKYRKQISTEMDGDIASWNIKVNDEDINEKKTLTNNITPEITSSEYVKDKKIAPGSSGYFTVTIDATNVDVDFKYELTTELNQDTNLTDFKISGYKINDGTLISTYNNKLTGEIQKNTPKTKITYYIMWDDDDKTQTMNNTEDTDYAKNHKDVKINLNIKFTQKKEARN